MRRPLPRSSLFPYTTLFRSADVGPALPQLAQQLVHGDVLGAAALVERLQRAMEGAAEGVAGRQDRKSTRLNSSHSQISYAVFYLKKKAYPIPAADSVSIDEK